MVHEPQRNGRSVSGGVVSGFRQEETCVVMLSPDAGSFFDLVEVEVRYRKDIILYLGTIPLFMDTLSYGIVV